MKDNIHPYFHFFIDINKIAMVKDPKFNNKTGTPESAVCY